MDENQLRTAVANLLNKSGSNEEDHRITIHGEIAIQLSAMNEKLSRITQIFEALIKSQTVDVKGTVDVNEGSNIV